MTSTLSPFRNFVHDPAPFGCPDLDRFPPSLVELELASHVTARDGHEIDLVEVCGSTARALAICNHHRKENP